MSLVFYASLGTMIFVLGELVLQTMTFAGLHGIVIALLFSLAGN